MPNESRSSGHINLIQASLTRLEQALTQIKAELTDAKTTGATMIANLETASKEVERLRDSTDKLAERVTSLEARMVDKVRERLTKIETRIETAEKVGEKAENRVLQWAGLAAAIIAAGLALAAHFKTPPPSSSAPSSSKNSSSGG